MGGNCGQVARRTCSMRIRGALQLSRVPQVTDCAASIRLANFTATNLLPRFG